MADSAPTCPECGGTAEKPRPLPRRIGIETECREAFHSPSVQDGRSRFCPICEPGMSARLREQGVRGPFFHDTADPKCRWDDDGVSEAAVEAELSKTLEWIQQEFAAHDARALQRAIDQAPTHEVGGAYAAALFLTTHLVECCDRAIADLRAALSEGTADG